MGHFPIICKSVPVKTVNQVLETEDDLSPTFVGGVATPSCSNTSMAEPAANPQTSRSDPGWHVKLKIQDQDMLIWCIDTGAQVSVMPEAIYKLSYGMLSTSDRELVGAGDVPLVTLGCAVMNLTLDETIIEERVYVVRGASKLLLGIPAIRSLGLIHESQGHTVSSSDASIRRLINIHSNQGQRRTLSSSTRRSFKASANWRVSIQFI